MAWTPQKKMKLRQMLTNAINNRPEEVIAALELMLSEEEFQAIYDLLCAKECEMREEGKAALQEAMTINQAAIDSINSES